MCFSCLGIQEDDPLLGDEEIYARALVSSSFFNFLSLGSEHITPEKTMMHDIRRHQVNVLFPVLSVKLLLCHTLKYQVNMNINQQ